MEPFKSPFPTLFCRSLEAQGRQKINALHQLELLPSPGFLSLSYYECCSLEHNNVKSFLRNDFQKPQLLFFFLLQKSCFCPVLKLSLCGTHHIDRKNNRRSQHLARGVLSYLGGVSLNHKGPFVASQKRDLLLFVDFSLFLAAHWQDPDTGLLENLKWILHFHIIQFGALLVWMSL